MTAIVTPKAGSSAWPDHTQLPESDGKIVENFLEHPQGSLLRDSIWPVLEQWHPDGQFAIGLDSGIYWDFTDPPLDGCKSPDWFYVPNVPPMLEGRYRRSYVLWKERIPPTFLAEIVSGDGQEERDRTPRTGKFWVYEQAIKALYYAIYEPDLGRVEVHRLIDGCFNRMTPNERGHFPIAPMGVELGIWQGRYKNMDVPWLRWWDAQGNLLLVPEEKLIAEHIEKEQAQKRVEELAAKLRALGADPENL